ncbi:unnamed protein product [Linum tenue]|uniref:Uncharacterized protein n=1 Tax=Linum tenue TaxID=586396 RepID=A0AAV0K4H2_9ROSI|nr:unnamed protein product [Linum tenue]CAI0416045.1 unnamed protein product [Linum tenue]
MPSIDEVKCCLLL